MTDDGRAARSGGQTEPSSKESSGSSTDGSRSDRPPLSELEPKDFADFEPADWSRYDLDEIEALDFSKVPDSALPTDARCPRCHWPVFVETVRGPGEHILRPCGCRVGLF